MNKTTDEYIVPSGDYDRSVLTAIQRRTAYTFKENVLTSESCHRIDGKTFIVRSVFDMKKSKDVEKAIQKLIENNS